MKQDKIVRMMTTRLEECMKNIPENSHRLIKRIIAYNKIVIRDLKLELLKRIEEQIRLDNDVDDIPEILSRDLTKTNPLNLPPSLLSYLTENILLMTWIQVYFNSAGNYFMPYYRSSCSLERHIRSTKPHATLFLQSLVYLMFMRCDVTLKAIVFSYSDRTLAALKETLNYIWESEDKTDTMYLNKLHEFLETTFNFNAHSSLLYALNPLRKIMTVLIVCIPFILQNRDLLVHKLLYHFNRIEYFNPALDPKTAIGLYVYLTFFDPVHILMIYEDLAVFINLPSIETFIVN